MNEEVELIIEEFKDSAGHALQHLEREMVKIRASKANPSMLDSVYIDYYGVHTQLSKVANINTTDARTLLIQPWDKKMLDPIEKAILKANLGFTPSNNGEVIRINVPPLTEERRRSLVKQVKQEGETAKVSVRNVRRDMMEELKRLKKNGLPEDEEKEAEELVQKLTDDNMKKIEKALEKKEAEIMTV